MAGELAGTVVLLLQGWLTFTTLWMRGMPGGQSCNLRQGQPATPQPQPAYVISCSACTAAANYNLLVHMDGRPAHFFCTLKPRVLHADSAICLRYVRSLHLPGKAVPHLLAHIRPD